jgi:hypothetical protein
VVHVPASQIHLVQKYVGAFRGHPKLSVLGGRAWAHKKEQVTEAVTDLAGELLETLGCPVYPAAGPDEKYFYAHERPFKNILTWKVAGLIQDASFLVDFAHDEDRNRFRPGERPGGLSVLASIC